jgi:hypothetical protein
MAVSHEIARLAQQPTAERVAALKRIIPLRDVQAVLRQTGQTRRHCPRLPPSFMAWFVISLALFATDSYRQVFRWLSRFRRHATPGRSSLCEARHRLGVAPLRLLAQRAIRLQATPDTPGCFYQGLRLMALDGFVLDLPDSAANGRVFSHPRNGRARGAFPQVRILSLCEAGTHVLYRSVIKPRRRGEAGMMGPLLKQLRPDMLLLWDRNFLSYHAAQQVGRQGTPLLARIKKNLIFEPRRRLGDGSYLAKLYRSASDRGRDVGGIAVRVIEYTLTDPGRQGSGQKQRLLTTLLDEKQHPAQELVVLYHERWEEELALDELKTHQAERAVLRSETPAGVIQEIYGLLLGHYVVRKLMCEAAASEGQPPRRLSFVGALKILRCRLPECPKSPRGLRRWYEELLAEVAEEVLPERRERANPRVIKKQVSKWAKKHPGETSYPQPTKKFRQAIVILR